ncbi:MAG: hypothetical protein ACI4MI_04140 [Christensenellales bacterium]
MRKNLASSTTFKLLVILFLIAFAACIIYSADMTYAQNSNVKLQLCADSVFDTDGDVIAYTNSTTLSVAKDDVVYTCATPLTATAKQVTIVGGYIAVLTVDGELNGYALNNGELAPSNEFWDKIPNLDTQLDGTIRDIYSMGNTLYIMTYRQVLQYAFDDPITVSFAYNFSDLFDFDGFAIMGGTMMYAIKNQSLYCFANGNVSVIPAAIESSYLFNSIDCHGGYLYLNTDTKIVRYDPSSSTFTQLGNTPDKDGKIVYASVNGKDNLFVGCYLDNSIKQYVVDDDAIRYVNSFDNTIYSHPTVYDVIKVAIASTSVSAYVSPRTLISVRDFSAGERLLILTTQDGYYYVTDGNGKFGYIPTSSDMIILEMQTDTIYGTHVSVLHPDTPIYSLPYDSSQVLCNQSITERLAVIGCVGVRNGEDVWGWYAVNYMAGDVLMTGYVKATDIAPYTSLTAPAVKKSVKIKADKFGDVVTIYSLPDAESPKVVDLVDGKTVLLLQTYDPTSQWTTVQYGDSVGYVKTANIQIDGLTNVQIFIIVAVSLVVVATATILTIVLIKKRQNKY